MSGVLTFRVRTTALLTRGAFVLKTACLLQRRWTGSSFFGVRALSVVHDSLTSSRTVKVPITRTLPVPSTCSRWIRYAKKHGIIERLRQIHRLCTRKTLTLYEEYIDVERGSIHLERGNINLVRGKIDFVRGNIDHERGTH